MEGGVAWTSMLLFTSVLEHRKFFCLLHCQTVLTSEWLLLSTTRSAIESISKVSVTLQSSLHTDDFSLPLWKGYASLFLYFVPLFSLKLKCCIVWFGNSLFISYLSKCLHVIDDDLARCF